MIPSTCPECGAALPHNMTCRELFENALVDAPEDAYATNGVHHLIILCYILQHPGFYSEKALAWAYLMLDSCVEKKLSMPELQQRVYYAFDPARRTWTVTAANGRAFAPMAKPSRWAMTIADILSGTRGGRSKRILRWAEVILMALLSPPLELN